MSRSRVTARHVAVTALLSISSGATVIVPDVALAQSPAQVAEIFRRNQAKMVRFTEECRRRGKPASVPMGVFFKNVPGAKSRPDLVNAILILGGYTATDVFNTYVKKNVITSPNKILNLMQRTGLTPQQAAPVLNAMGGTYASMAGKAYDSAPVQSIISIAGKIEGALPGDWRNYANTAISTIGSGAQEAVEVVGDGLTTAANEVVEVFNDVPPPSDW